MPYGFYGYYWDSTYLLVLIGAAICLIASAKVKGTFRKYDQVRSMSGMTGAQAAERILQSAGINDVKIQHVRGELTDHYNPKTKVVALSDSVYDRSTVAAVSVAAHECGHAMQHKEGYAPLNFRSAIVPVARFGSMLAWPLIIIGLFFTSQSGSTFITIGILCFTASVLFQICTLPVEYNASSRAVGMLGNTGVLGSQETEGSKKVLNAAALTYVASAAAAILQLLRLILLFGNRGRKR